MITGAGKYNDLCTYVREQSEGMSVMVLVIHGKRGSGFARQVTSMDTDHTLQLMFLEIESLRKVADDLELEAERIRTHARTGFLMTDTADGEIRAARLVEMRKRITDTLQARGPLTGAELEQAVDVIGVMFQSRVVLYLALGYMIGERIVTVPGGYRWDVNVNKQTFSLTPLVEKGT